MLKYLSLIISLLALFTYCANAQTSALPQTGMRPGLFMGVQFGYLDTDYDDDLNLYAPGRQSESPDGSYFQLRPYVGYNFTPLLGVELGALQLHDKAVSFSSDPIQKASVNLTNVSLLALLHLKIDDARTWVGTPKVGLSLMSSTLDYAFYSASGDPAPWHGGSNVSDSAKKQVLVPTIGIEFAHSYNRHWMMTFSYTYYYAKYTHYNDPYNTAMSTLDYFAVGTTYKF